MKPRFQIRLIEDVVVLLPLNEAACGPWVVWNSNFTLKDRTTIWNHRHRIPNEIIFK